MNIYAVNGHKVRFLGKNGYDYELEQAMKVLEVNKEYTVERTEVHDWSTTVYLIEVPNVGFNSVQFEDVK